MGGRVTDGGESDGWGGGGGGGRVTEVGEEGKAGPRSYENHCRMMIIRTKAE